MHTQLYTNVTMNSAFKNGKRKKTMPLEDYFSNMIPRDPQIDHNSDIQLPEYCW